MLVDVHGDEELPYCFVAGSEGVPGWSDRLAGLQKAFCDAFKRSSPDFQTKVGYEVDPPGQANMSICGNQVSEWRWSFDRTGHHAHAASLVIQGRAGGTGPSAKGKMLAGWVLGSILVASYWAWGVCLAQGHNINLYRTWWWWRRWWVECDAFSCAQHIDKVLRQVLFECVSHPVRLDGNPLW